MIRGPERQCWMCGRALGLGGRVRVPRICAGGRCKKIKIEGVGGFEPPTIRSAGGYSTTELNARFVENREELESSFRDSPLLLAFMAKSTRVCGSRIRRRLALRPFALSLGLRPRGREGFRAVQPRGEPSAHPLARRPDPLRRALRARRGARRRAARRGMPKAYSEDLLWRAVGLRRAAAGPAAQGVVSRRAPRCRAATTMAGSSRTSHTCCACTSTL